MKRFTARYHARRMRSRTVLLTLTAALAASLLTAACDSGNGGSNGAPEAPVTVERPRDDALGWEDCSAETECATLDVPLDYDDPDGETIGIALARRRALGGTDEWAGVLLVNLGGPGATGIDVAFEAEYIFPRELLERFDIVGFDPRGIGESAPVDCGDAFFEPIPEDWTPEDATEQAAIIASAREFAEACLERNGDVVPHMNTMNTARDLDRIREALGVDRISYLGKSYGTVLGALYADLYPERVRAFILDGAVDMAAPFEQYHTEQARSFEATLGAFLARCAELRTCDLHARGDPEAAYDELLGRLEERSLPAPRYEDDDVRLTQADAQSAVVSALYSESAWPQLALALVEALEDEDGSLLLDLAYGAPEDGGSQFSGANAIIFCADRVAPRTAAAYHELSEELRETAPRVGATVAYWYPVCAFLPEPREPLDGAWDAKGAPAILVVGATGDAATPYAWSERVAERLESGHLLTYEGHDHTAAFSAVSTCVDEAALRYLLELTLPEADC